MPTYNYGCDACGHEFEREQRMSDKPIKKCPKCSKPKARRLVASGNFILKGSGWYADGYGSSASAPKNKGSDSAENTSSDSSSNGDSSGDAKPAKKKKAKSGEAGSTSA